MEELLRLFLAQRAQQLDLQLFGFYDGFRDAVLAPLAPPGLPGAGPRLRVVSATLDDRRTLDRAVATRELGRAHSLAIGSLRDSLAALRPEGLGYPAGTPLLPPLLFYWAERPPGPSGRRKAQAAGGGRGGRGAAGGGGGGGKPEGEGEPGVPEADLELLREALQRTSALATPFPLGAQASAGALAAREVRLSPGYWLYLPQRNFSPDSDMPLPSPANHTGRQVQTLMGVPAYVDHLADWLLVRCPDTKRLPRPAQAGVRKAIVGVLRTASTLQMQDDEVYERLYRILHNKDRPPAELSSVPPNSSYRVSRRVSEFEAVVDTRFRPSSILDIGCSDGFMLEAFAAHFGVPRERAFGLDIRPPISKKISFIEGSGADAALFGENPALAAGFDLVFIAMTLHHIPRMLDALYNAARVVKPGGILFVREHDADRPDDALFVDIHDAAFNSCIWDKPELPWDRFVTVARSYFFPRVVLITALARAGMRLGGFRNFGDTVRDWRLHGCIYGAYFRPGRGVEEGVEIRGEGGERGVGNGAGGGSGAEGRPGPAAGAPATSTPATNTPGALALPAPQALARAVQRQADTLADMLERVLDLGREMQEARGGSAGAVEGVGDAVAGAATGAGGPARPDLPDPTVLQGFVRAAVSQLGRYRRRCDLESLCPADESTFAEWPAHSGSGSAGGAEDAEGAGEAPAPGEAGGPAVDCLLSRLRDAVSVVARGMRESAPAERAEGIRRYLDRENSFSAPLLVEDLLRALSAHSVRPARIVVATSRVTLCGARAAQLVRILSNAFPSTPVSLASLDGLAAGPRLEGSVLLLDVCAEAPEQASAALAGLAAKGATVFLRGSTLSPLKAAGPDARGAPEGCARLLRAQALLAEALDCCPAPAAREGPAPCWNSDRLSPRPFTYVSPSAVRAAVAPFGYGWSEPVQRKSFVAGALQYTILLSPSISSSPRQGPD